jgi:putative transposase
MASTLTNLLFHIIFSTKDRRRFIHPGLRDDLHHYIGGIIRKQSAKALAIGGTVDHVHILARLSPAVAMSHFVKNVKGGASTWVNARDEVDFHFSWQKGYGAFSVSQSNASTVARYIAQQEEHHRTRTFKEELVALLEKHDVDHDERYLWD